MLMHIVVFKWREGVTQEQIDGLHEELTRLPDRIPELLDYRHGPDLGLRPGTGDYGVAAVVAQPADVAAYLDHPEHVRIVEQYTNVMVDTRLAVQIDIGGAPR